MLLEFLKDAFSFLTSLPSKTYKIKKLTNTLGLGYEKSYASPNDCMLYWGPTKNHYECNACKANRVYGTKVLRYFPLIPRLRRLYSCPKFAKDMRWHHADHTKDGKLRHPVNGLA